MYSVISTAILHGISAILVQVETDISNGMPSFEMVGFLSAEVREAKERVRAALKNCELALPVKRITINISPAFIKKSGSGFDLPIAVSILTAQHLIPDDLGDQLFVVGEMGLDGSVRGINGILPMVMEAKKEKKKICIIPSDNLPETYHISDISIVGVSHLKEVLLYLIEGILPQNETQDEISSDSPVLVEEYQNDFSEIHGQDMLKRACEVAVSGMHNLLMIGPPGAGKTMIAKAIPSILPPMKEMEQLELSKIYSVCGLLTEQNGIIQNRPFRNPHHTISAVGLAGGGQIVHPGEISLAHHGILFLDELPEFQTSTLEILRQPMEEKQVHIVRASGEYIFPADFVFIAAMNPCKCGYFPDQSKCRCSRNQILNYLSKISQPLLDRIDICVEAPTLSFADISNQKKEESSATIRQRVISAHQLQSKRYEDKNYKYNSQVPPHELMQFCKLSAKDDKWMENIYEKMAFSARTYHKLLRVARTIADLDGSMEIKTLHLQEAICYRSVDKKYWESCI